MNSLLYLFDRIRDLYSGENYNKDVVDFINMFENAMKGVGGDDAYENLSTLIRDLIKDSLEEFKKEEEE